MSKLITYGSFKCSCGRKDCDAPRPSLRLLFKINRAAIRAGVSSWVSIRSGCRCEVGNKLEKGCPGSAHKLGLAADIDVSDLTVAEIRTFLECIERERFESRGYGIGFIHVDIRKYKGE